MARSVARLRTGWSGTQDKGTGGGGYGFTAEITGGPALAKALMALGSARDIQRVVTRAEKAAMAPVAAAAKRNAPRASGGMADSIDVRSVSSGMAKRMGAQFRPTAVGPDRDHFHALFAEFGTKHHAAQPFLRPAWDENKAQVLVDHQTARAREIEKRARRLSKKAGSK